MDAPNPFKRRRLTGPGESTVSDSGISPDSLKTTTALPSEVLALERSISPPLVRKKIGGSSSSPIVISDTLISPELISSPVSLTRVDSLSSVNNVDTVTLRDILGDPLIQECWAFNYLFDVDFLMTRFDPDVKDLVRVKVVHGSWKKEDSNRLHLQVNTIELFPLFVRFLNMPAWANPERIIRTILDHVFLRCILARFNV